MARQALAGQNGAVTERAFDLPRYLGLLPMFSDLGPAERQRLAAGCRLRRFARGEALFHIGDPCEEFHVAVTGQVKLFVAAPGGQEKVIELVGPGGSFAEALVFGGRRCIVGAQALADVLLLSIGRAAILAEIAADARVALRLLGGLSRRLHGLVADVQSLALHSGQQRVIGYLLRDAPGAGAATLTLPVKKGLLASRLSLTPEYFSRVLHELEAEGLLQVQGRQIHIADVARLSRHGAA